ncbi:hypothetical protein LTR56_024158 [Elasticomyces elasticus]|nr:hypothetical protein LTR56_024158 [Elasticomyces elasticus]KAK3622276.1 hypothetical protein LTR22_024862 [Elasticomyces elasticus]KAK4906444.1 hypothetical protein LTR49_024413 [Elasticomyces elasticus]KAK5754865.1 hypothetical protein LTS12_015081 [Elasticomyces elasticus]
MATHGRHTQSHDSSDDTMSGSESSTAADCESSRSGKYGASSARFEHGQQQSQQDIQRESASATADELDLLRECIATSDLSRTDRQKSLASLNKLHKYASCKSMQPLRDNAEAAGSGRAYQVKLQSLEDRLESLNAYVRLEAKSRASMSALYDREFLRVGQDMDITKNNTDALYEKIQELAGRSSNASEDHASAVKGGIFEMHALAEMVVDEKMGTLQATVEEEQKRRAAMTVLFEWRLGDLTSTLQKRNTSIAELQALLDKDMRDIWEAIEVDRQKTVQRAENTAGGTVELRKAVNGLISDMEGMKNQVQQLGQGPTASAVEDISARLQTTEKSTHRLNGRMDKMYTKVGTMKQQVLDSAAVDDIQRRLLALECQPASRRSVQEESPGAMLFDIEEDVERANSRIAQLESTVGDGLNDGRLADLELQLEDLSQKHEALAAEGDHHDTQNHVLDCVSTIAFNHELQHAQSRITKLETDVCDNQVYDQRLADLERKLQELLSRSERMSAAAPVKKQQATTDANQPLEELKARVKSSFIVETGKDDERGLLWAELPFSGLR